MLVWTSSNEQTGLTALTVSAGKTNIERRSNWPQHRRLTWPDERKCHLDNAAGETQRDADPPRHGVGAERIVDQPAAIGAEERAELVTHEGEALDHGLPFQAEHFDDGARDQRPDTHPQKSHDRAEQQRGGGR